MRMGKPYRPWNPDQAWLLPPSPQDWLPAGDLVYFLLDVTKTLDLSAITSWYERSERGQFLLRGLGKMRGEWRLVCLTHNLLKLFGSGRFAGGGSKRIAAT
jgi:hypothetical protein